MGLIRPERTNWMSSHHILCVCGKTRDRKMEVNWQFTIRFLHRRQGKSVRVCVCVRQTVTVNVSSSFLGKQRAWSVSAVLCYCRGSRWHLTTRAEFSAFGYNATHTHTHTQNNKVKPSSLEFNYRKSETISQTCSLFLNLGKHTIMCWKNIEHRMYLD